MYDRIPVHAERKYPDTRKKKSLAYVVEVPAKSQNFGWWVTTERILNQSYI